MNDLHVKAIHYFIKHDDSVSYQDVSPLVYEDELFRVKADKDNVVFEPKNHYTTEEDARSAVEGLVRQWDFEAALRTGSARFKLIYARVDIIDRNPDRNPPPPGVIPVSAIFHSRGGKIQARVSKVVAEYPCPPSGQVLEPDDPDASYMLSRLDLYRQGREPLGSVANLCLTVLEDSFSKKRGRRKRAADHYQIEIKVLKRVGDLSSKKGGSVARKAEGRSDAFTLEETRFLEAAATAFTRRAAEKAADPGGILPIITMADLPKLLSR